MTTSELSILRELCESKLSVEVPIGDKVLPKGTRENTARTHQGAIAGQCSPPASSPPAFLGHLTRLCARLTDGTSPANFAATAVCEALGVGEGSVVQLDAQPTAARSDAVRSCYPGVLCEVDLYVVRLCVEGLPNHGFRAQCIDWVWRPASSL